MDLAELIDLGKRLGLSGDGLTEWALEEQRLWREEIALRIEAPKRLAEIEKERAEIEKKTLKLRQQLAELEATGSEARLSKDGGKSFDKVQAFSPPRSSADQLSPSLDVARDANEHRELDVTVEHQAALSSPDKETSLSLSPQVAALHLTLSGFARLKSGALYQKKSLSLAGTFHRLIFQSRVSMGRVENTDRISTKGDALAGGSCGTREPEEKPHGQAKKLR
ncbi:hypothetical protein HPB48_010006 [Haemaphysalis longicornis]|uniref:Uncharacterized protein n=1 Tax=Haemaphysalis longicornis TaxID=44386 RepID=A0A9J6GDE6_HAELO|nr:hypothetical protein HPB48_010006 [Haemaphysalis longicornis]